MDSPWLVRLKSPESQRITLICFHFAGGAASTFMPWAKALPDDVGLLAIQLPGRWERIREPLMTDIGLISDEIQAALMKAVHGPYAIVGYSLGTLIAFEVARKIQSSGFRLPQHFIALARNGPQYVYQQSKLSEAPDDRIIEQIQLRYGGVPQALLAEPELVEIYRPILRADFHIFEHYRFSAGEKLKFPITAWSGKSDRGVSLDGLKMWGELTEGPFSFEQFDGSHFFVESNGPRFFARLAAELKL